MCATAVWACTNLELDKNDLFTMWASPNNILTNISFTLSGIVITALSTEDKCLISFVERAANKTKLVCKRIVVYKSYYINI